MYRSLTLGLVTGGIFLALALRSIDLENINHVIGKASFGEIPMILASLSAFYLLKGVRWRLLLATRYQGSFFPLMSPLMIGFAANNVFPLPGG